MVDILNDAFSGAKMRFFKHSINFIDNDEYYILENDFERRSITSNNISNVINVYCVSSNGILGSIGTYTPDILNIMGYDLDQCIIMINNKSLTSALPHEFGHFFNLFHTFDTTFGQECPNGSNCNTAGDLICDTPAEPEQGLINFDTNCHFTQTSAVRCGISFDKEALEQINAHNFMSYACDNCRQEFTNEQLRKIRTTLKDKRTYLIKKWVQFENRINNENAGGNLLVDATETILSGTYLYFLDSDQHNVKTLNERFNLNKHHDWNRNNQNYTLKNSFNLPQIYIKTEQIANFVEIYPVVVKNIMNGSDNISKNSIQFHDPWYVDENNNQPDDFLPFTTPYSPTGNANEKNGGVFLDQNPDPNDPNKPFYSVKADAQQTFTAHGKSITGYFLNWEGDSVNFRTPNLDTSAVVFTNANAEARAVYKGHLASNVSRASGYNNGRRICKTGDGKLHLVYEDDNTIWYTYSSDGGKTWAKEYAISPRPYSSNSIRHTFKNPSIASFGSTLYVVFEEIVQSNSATNHLIDFRKRWNNSWRPIENISDGSWQGSWWNGPWSERPSVAANEVNNIFVSWRDKTNHRIKARYYYNNQTWSYISTIYADGYLLRPFLRRERIIR